MTNRCSIFCSQGNNCISSVLSDNHRRCLIDAIINRVFTMSGAIDILLVQYRDCIGDDVADLIMSIQRDIASLTMYTRKITDGGR
jgi:hypothetical protein